MRFKKFKTIIVKIFDIIDRITNFLVYFPLSNPIEQWRNEIKKAGEK